LSQGVLKLNTSSEADLFEIVPSIYSCFPLNFLAASGNEDTQEGRGGEGDHLAQVLGAC
jgi:hypothetical protein